MHFKRSTSHADTPHASQSQGGFALVIALGLMAFILLLLVSMTTLVQVETQSAQVTTQRLHAEQNALTGALIALGELQRHSGVDQCSTASAGIEDADPATPAIDGVVHPQWMGVRSYDAVTDTYEWQTWLVSGNHGKNRATFLDPATPLTGAGIAFPTSPFAKSSNAADYVEVPLVYMDAQRHNGFAYWVLGQQERADVGIARPTDPSSTNLEGSGVLGGHYNLGVLGLDKIDPQDPALSKLSYLAELPLIDGAIDNGDTTQLEASAGALTAGNYGLLTNARDGGLKVDLTSKLEKVAVDDATPWVDFSPYTNLDGTPIPQNNYTTASPTWGKLKAFYDLKDTMVADGQLTPQPSTNAQPGISPRIAMCSFTVATGTKLDTLPTGADPVPVIEVVFQPEVVLHNPYNVPLAPQKYMVNFFGLAPRFDSEGNSHIPQNSPRSCELVYSNNPDYIWTNEDGLGAPQGGEREAFLQLSWGHLRKRTNQGNLRKEISDDESTTRQRAGEPSTWGDTKNYPPGAPRFELDCNIVMQPGEAIVFTPPSEPVPGQRIPFDRMAPVSNVGFALTPGLRTSYYLYPTSPNWRLLPKDYGGADPTTRGEDRVNVRIKNAGSAVNDAGFFDATLSVLDSVTDQEGEDVASLFYHNNKRRSYMARQAGADFEDRIFQTTGRIEFNYKNDFSKNTDRIYYSNGHPVNPGVNSATWRMVAYDLIDPLSPDRAYNPYKYFNPRAKIMERSDLKTRKANGRDADTAVTEPTENYFYDVRVSDLQDNSLGVLDTYGSEDSKVRIGGGLRNPIANTMVLYDVPYDATGLYSLGQLQHFQLSDYFDEAGYAIGNSLRSPHLAGEELFHAGLGVISWLDELNEVEGTVDYSTIDLSYIFNDALWDRYFFSTTAQLTQAELDAGTPLPNPRMQPIGGAALVDLQDPDEAAANLMVQGAFNVNSTSVKAWKALLAGNHQRYEGADGTPLESPFFRLFSQDLGQINELSSGYSEVGTLAGGAGGPSPLDKLAEAIVEQVKQRGPFASLADFVNRKRVLDPGDDSSLNESGALQAAIDKSGINAAIADAESIPTNPKMTGFVDFSPSYTLEGSSIEGLPGMLSQADVLTAIGPYLTTRSDTFTILTYGEHRNSIGDKAARVALEMTVQRMPDYVDSTDEASVHPNNTTIALNQNFGRHFKIVGMRWLDLKQLQLP